MKKFALLLLLQFMGVWLFAMPNETFGSFQISGKITDENGKPLIGATIIIENSLEGTTSDLDGNYIIKRVKSGTYTLTVSFVGYEKKSEEITVDKDIVLNITLKPSSIMGEEIVVSSTRASSKVPIAQTTMSKDDINKSSVGFDIPYLLEMTPSVVATSEGGTGIGNTAFRIRGSDMSRINVTVNGIPLNDAESQGVYWVDLPDFTSSVDNVQVQRGVGSSTNGAGAFGASINFQTTTLSTEPYTNVEFQSGSFNTNRTSVKIGTGLIDKQFSFEGRYTQLKSDGYIDRGTSDNKSMFITGAWHTSKSLLRVNIIHGEEHTGITWTGTPGYMLDSIRTYNPEGIYYDKNNEMHYYKDQKDNYVQTHYQLMYSYQITHYLNLSAALHLTRGAGYYEEYKDDTKFSKYGLDAQVFDNDTIKYTDLIRRKWMDNNFYGATLSLNYHKDAIDATFGGAWNEYDGNHFGRIMWTEVNNGIPKNYEWYRNKGIKTDFNIFGKAIWQVTNRFNLYGDLQLRLIDYKLKGPDDDLASLNQKHSWGFLNPKFGTQMKISSNQEVNFSVGVANREPTREDIKDAMKYGTHNTPKAENLIDFELGYSYKQPSFAAGINLYYMYYEDQLVKTGELSDVGYPIMSNVKSSYRSGIELTLGIKPTSWLTWSGTATISRNIIKNYIDRLDSIDNPDDWNPLGQIVKHYGDSPISFSPSLIGSSKFDFTIVKGLNIALISKYVGKQYYDNTGSNARSLDAYLVNNLQFDYKLALKGAKSVSLQLFINNIFDKEYIANAWIYRAYCRDTDSIYREDGYFPQAGINFMAKVGVVF